MNPPPTRPKWRKGHKIAIGIVGGLFVLVLLIAVIAAIAGGGGDPDPEGIPDGFDAYVTDLAAIDPAITADRDEDALYNDANNTCADIQAGDADDVLIPRVLQRYGVNEAEAVVTEDVAAQILAVTREHCDTIRPE
jgi:hypothetical protein